MKRLVDDKIISTEIIPEASEDGGTLHRTTVGTTYTEESNISGVDGEEISLKAMNTVFNGTEDGAAAFLYAGKDWNGTITLGSDVEANIMNVSRLNVGYLKPNFTTVAKTVNKVYKKLGKMIFDTAYKWTFVPDNVIAFSASTTISRMEYSNTFYTSGQQYNFGEWTKIDLEADDGSGVIGQMYLVASSSTAYKICVDITVANKTCTLKKYHGYEFYADLG